MSRVCVYGVVKNGQVVLEVPLPLADGTRIAVSTAELQVPIDWSEADKGKFLTTINRMDLINDPDWLVKCEADRVATAEKLVLEAAAMRAARAATVASRTNDTPTTRP